MVQWNRSFVPWFCLQKSKEKIGIPITSPRIGRNHQWFMAIFDWIINPLIQFYSDMCQLWKYIIHICIGDICMYIYIHIIHIYIYTHILCIWNKYAINIYIYRYEINMLHIYIYLYIWVHIHCNIYIYIYAYPPWHPHSFLFFSTASRSQAHRLLLGRRCDGHRWWQTAKLAPLRWKAMRWTDHGILYSIDYPWFVVLSIGYQVHGIIVYVDLSIYHGIVLIYELWISIDNNNHVYYSVWCPYPLII